MKKFILLFAMTIVSLSVVEAQQIIKIYGKNNMPAFPNWVNFETDTLQYNSSTRLQVNMYFAVVYENGSTPLEAGDIIVLDLKISTTNIFDYLDDSLHYVLNAPLAANDTLWIDLNSVPEQMQNFPNAFEPIDDFRDKVPLTATIYRTSKFSVPMSNRIKQVPNAHFLRTTGSSNLAAEKAIQNVQLFPNPVNSSLNITNLSNTKVEIFNVVGQRILTYGNANGNLNIDMTAYPNGIYFVKMQNGKSVRTEKIKLVK